MSFFFIFDTIVPEGTPLLQSYFLTFPRCSPCSFLLEHYLVK
nr:MAG TPA_asm: hypothetical protein [Bacteriophage sp.]